MNYNRRLLQSSVSVVLVVMTTALVPPNSWSFDSGSTGKDGAFSPIVDTTLDLPPDGVFNFTSSDFQTIQK